jgi:hypothetical protein
VNLRLALTFLAFGFVGLLLVLGFLSMVRWMRHAYPKHFRLLLAAVLLGGIGLGAWGYLEAQARPTFHLDDLITLQEPLVVRIIPTERLAPVRSCIVEIHEHLAILDVGPRLLKARVESNGPADPAFCPVGAAVEFERPWLHAYTLTRR